MVLGEYTSILPLILKLVWGNVSMGRLFGDVVNEGSGVCVMTTAGADTQEVSRHISNKRLLFFIISLLRPKSNTRPLVR